MLLLSTPYPADLYLPSLNQPIRTFSFTFDHGLIIPYILLLRFHPGMYISIEEWKPSPVDGTPSLYYIFGEWNTAGASRRWRGGAGLFYTALGHPTSHLWHTHVPTLEKWELI